MKRDYNKFVSSDKQVQRAFSFGSKSARHALFVAAVAACTFGITAFTALAENSTIEPNEFGRTANEMTGERSPEQPSDLSTEQNDARQTLNASARHVVMTNSANLSAPQSASPSSKAATLLKRWQADPTEEDLRRHPFLRFRMFANKPLPPVRSFLFLLFVSIVCSEVFPARLRQARQQCSRNFWKCFWGGILGTLLFCTLARTAYFSEVGMPLAQVAIGILQLMLLAGFAVVSNLIGQTLLTSLRVKPDVGSERQWLRRLGSPLLGSFLLSMLLIIPPLGILPRIGVRLILLFCFLGMGAWFRTGLGTKQLDTTSEI